MRFLQILFILIQLPAAIVFRRKDQTAYLLYLIGRGVQSDNNEVRHSHYNPHMYPSFMEIDEDIKHSEYLLTQVP
jgi:hypothetical protein